jgi:hypothetical protein
MDQQKKKGFSGIQVLAIGFGLVVATVVLTLFAARAWLFPKPFEPVVLSPAEEQVLEKKLSLLEGIDRKKESGRTSVARRKEPAAHPLETGPARPDEFTTGGELRPEAYSEEGASREVTFTEREVNSLLARNTDLARKVAIDLGQDLVSLKILVPVDPDFPFLGGKTLRVRAGAELAYKEGRPLVKLRGVSIMGVPVPNAWLGGLKNIDLVQEFGGDSGFWKTFAEGVDAINVREGSLYIKFKE